MFTLNYEKEAELFNQRNQDFIELFPILKQALSEISKQISSAHKSEAIILMLGRACFRHYESIVFLCLNGFGFRAMAELRSFFEKCVDAAYLIRHPDEIDVFDDYKFVQLVKTGHPEKAKEIDENYEDRIKKFKTQNGWKNSWSKPKLGIRKRAELIGFENWLIIKAYIIPNEFVHTSCAELELNLKEDVNGVRSPIDSGNPAERKLADMAFQLANILLIEVLDTQIAFFDLEKNPKLEEFVDALEQMRI